MPALEILVVNKAIANLIRENKTFQIPSPIQTGAAQGMIGMDDSLNRARQGECDHEGGGAAHAEDPRADRGVGADGATRRSRSAT